MRLLFFNRSFHPDGEASGQLLTELCEDLSHDHQVTVIAGRPYNMDRFGSWSPIKREWLGHVEILRAYNPRFNKGSFIGRLMNLFSYFCFSLLAGFSARRPDVVIAETDPPVLGLAGWFFAALYRAKFIFYVQDVFPDVGIALGKIRSPILISLLEASTRFILRHADQVVVLGEDMRKRLETKGCVSADRFQVIPNWVDTKRVQPAPSPNSFRADHGVTDRFVVMFSGNIGLSQGLDHVLDAAAALSVHEQIRFLFVGEGAAKAGLMAKAQALGLNNVVFLPYQPKEDLSVSLSAADVHLVTLQRSLAGLIVPSKVYGIMAAGRPFIAAIEQESEPARIIGEHGCGIRIEPDNAATLSSSILWCLHNPDSLQEMGRRGREAAVRCFDRRVSVVKFHSLLEQLRQEKIGHLPPEETSPLTSYFLL